jgi:hypothetical protein
VIPIVRANEGSPFVVDSATCCHLLPSGNKYDAPGAIRPIGPVLGGCG